MDLRMRLFTAAYDRLRLLDVTGASPARLAFLRRPTPRTPLTALVTGRVPRGIGVSDRVFDARGGSRTVRVYRPSTPGPHPLVLNMHGGGWVLGNLAQSDWWCGQLAALGDAVVVSVDYRLAPEHPYPAAVHDCWDALLWAVEHAGELGADPGHVAVTGDSAGGNLAAVLALQARDAGGPAIRSQLLVYPAVDLSVHGPSHGTMPDAPILPLSSRDSFSEAYLGTPPADPDDPYLSPLRAPSLAGLPPALILCAEHDPLTSEGRAYTEALVAAGVPVRFVEYARMPHGFVSFPGLSRAAPQAAAEAARFLRGDVPDLPALA